MAKPLSIDTTYLSKILVGLLEIPSPSGFTEDGVEFVGSAMRDLGLEPRKTAKGALVAELDGQSSETPRGLTAHIDTLGAMVKEIKSNGRLRLTPIGGFDWGTVEGESCSVFTATGSVFRGSILSVKASRHVHGRETDKLKRTSENLEVRLDERTSSEDETRALGIHIGDFVSFDPRIEVSPSGFIRSRHLDDKAGVACLLAAVQAMRTTEIALAQRTTLHISTYEEVGHGAAAGLPDDLVELVAVDMAAVGDGQESDEFHTTICAKDSGGPYHVDLTRRLRSLAEQANIPYKVDIYPHYQSDGEAYWRAGGDVQVALLGPGVDASHNYERTHMDALTATSQLIVEYLRQ